MASAHHEIEIRATPDSQSGRASSHSYATSGKMVVLRKQPLKATSSPSTEAGQVLKPPIGRFVINVSLQVAGIIAAVAFGVFAIKAVTVGNQANGYASQANGYASQAMELAKMANQLTLLTLCLTSNSSADVDQICSPVVDRAISMLPDTVSSLFSLSITSHTTSATTSSTYSTQSPSTRSGFNNTYSKTTFSTIASSSTATTSSTRYYTSFPSATPSGPKSKPASSLIGGITGAIACFAVILVAISIVYRLRTHRKEAAEGRPEEKPEKPPAAEDTPAPVEGTEDTPVTKQSTFAKEFRRLFVDTRVVPIE
ncbi:uncharacterized protein BDR25DRAFT_13458 [Lindgomyces ingoldianus]|uniref:Uncharacterized protein n=1 Tax=Lindgomyces ingoldianus TaxID=673940 RepID=A0ACB6R1K6_9PLEO|nr:uncharacterized protein BDR25DRAFT_13458 [Lindgomyces ingoldianus]KAF2472326.1 hypothetical protein BDR25DRAFT_13458 [Lindgomyces ingoldianus]